MWKLSLAILLLIAPFFSCAQKTTQNTFIFTHDTLLSKISLCDSQKSKSFYRLKTLIIDSNLILIDSVVSDFNKDRVLDFVLVLSTKIQEGDLSITDCNKKYNKRLIVVLLSTRKEYYAPIINENVILNTAEYQSNPFRKIEKLKNGFLVKFYFGTRIRYYYDFYFAFDGKKDFYLYKSKSENYDIRISGANESREDKYSKTQLTNLKKLNIRDFIKKRTDP
jgi:hypothetical protein